MRVARLLRLYDRLTARPRLRTQAALSLALACATTKELDAYYRAVMAKRAATREPTQVPLFTGEESRKVEPKSAKISGARQC